VSKKISLLAAVPAAFVIALTAGAGPLSAGEVRVVSDTTVTGFTYPESVAYDANAKVLYVSEFGSELKPTLKDGAGRISKVALDGTILEQGFLPAAGQTLNKPKGVWVAGDRLWTTDIDSVWVFDTATKEGRKVDLPGIKFANDPTVIGNTLYVSDNRGDQLYSVEPADFLNAAGDPKVTLVWSGKEINPNGVAPAADGSLLLVGFGAKETPRGIHVMAPGGEIKALSEGIGRLDGVYEMADGSLLITDWNSGSLGLWSAAGGVTILASGFKGPADFAVVPNADGLLVVVPDLVKSELRLIQLGQ
jgi:sugar lactone lactonase YvrE